MVVNVNPQAFLSHSSADKESIVRPLDELLRERGIVVWLDERDMLAGSNIVDEIFTRGISPSDVVVVILTPNSISNRWVHEELSVAVVRKISGSVKAIIPVIQIIKDEQVPDALAATRWIRLQNSSSLELARCADEIKASIFGRMPAPVAPPPPYAGAPLHGLPLLTPDDERVLVLACRQMLERDKYYPHVMTEELITSAEALGLIRSHVLESVGVLEQHGYITEVQYYLGAGDTPNDFSVSTYGMEVYLTAYDAERYRDAKRRVVSEIENRDKHDLGEIVASTGIKEALVTTIFKQLEAGGYGEVSEYLGGVTIFSPNATLHRLLESL